MPFDSHLLIGVKAQYKRDSLNSTTPVERYQRAAEALNLDLDTLLPPAYREAATKIQEWHRFLDSKRDQKPEPFDPEWIMSTAPNTWGQRLSAHATAKAQAQVVGTLLPMADNLQRLAEGHLTGAEAFDHVMSVVDVDALVAEVDAAAEELAAVNVNDPTVSRDYERYRATMEALLSLDVALKLRNHDPVTWAALWRDPGDLKPLRTTTLEKFNGFPTKTRREFSDADRDAHNAVQVWHELIRDQDSDDRRTMNSPIGGSFSGRSHEYLNVAPGDGAVSALAVGDLRDDFGLSLNVATSWAELERRVEMFKVAGSRESVDAENVA